MGKLRGHSFQWIIFFLLPFLLSLQNIPTEAAPVQQQSNDAELAQELSNPVADLITLPVQMNYDSNIGPDDDGWKLQTNIQPVIPVSMNDDWNIITRTIIPVTSQEDIFTGSGSQFGLGDINFSMFFSPREPTESGLIWGLGPVLLLPTATADELGTEKWSAGPSIIALTVKGPWTIGVLANHIWSFTGESDRQDVSSTFAQPFVAYTWSNAWTISVQSESTYNWESENWSIPINAAVSKLVKIGKLPVSLQAGIGYWAESPDSGPEDFRFRLQATFVLPKSIFN